MAHFTACALIPVESIKARDEFLEIYKINPGPIFDLITKRIQSFMDRYNREREVEPYKVYLTPEEISQVVERYQLDAHDSQSIVARLEGWFGGSGGYDEEGIYYMTQNNPEARFDYWGVYEILSVSSLLSQLNEWQDRFPHAVLFPNGEWLESKESFFYISWRNEKQFKEWKSELCSKLSMYERCLVALVDCHR